MEDQVKPSTIWIDVEDLFQYALHMRRPSGIQRIEYELCRALATMPESRSRVTFLRHADAGGAFQPVPYQAIEALFGQLVAEPSSEVRRGATGAEAGLAGAASRRGVLGLFRRLVYRLPADLRVSLLTAYGHQRSALKMIPPTARATSQTARRLWRATRARLRRPDPHDGGGRVGPVRRDANFDDAAAGDILLVLGSPWFQSSYAELIARARRENGVRFALLVYDLIPLRRPEWCDANLVAHFRAWFDAVLPLTDIVLTISNASAGDIVLHAEAASLTLHAPPRVIRIGTGFSGVADAAPVVPARDPSLPPADSYVLIVCTIEARKNHILLFRVWRRLLDEKPAADVPTLVIAGRVGWLVADLMQQLRNAAYLGGKIVLIEAPSDQELHELYRGCLFTVFPSFYEGWGLPVTESLAFGRPCVISRSTSLPEAGGTLARYFDPDDLNEAYRVIRATIEDRDGLKEWQARVVRDFRPVGWDASARSLLACLEDDGTPASA